MRFSTERRPPYGECTTIAPGLRRVVAQNPSKFTYHGTGTYIVGEGDVVVIDPGPADERHLDALAAATRDERIRTILVTHTHGDHSPASAPLARTTGAEVLAHGPHPPSALDADAATPAEEHADLDFEPTRCLSDREEVPTVAGVFVALHTPGHISNHLCYGLPERRWLFPGDHVMGWSTTVIPPPDGDMTAYLDSLRLLLDEPYDRYFPTHGPPIDEPSAHVEALIEHRMARERSILEELDSSAKTPAELVAVLYADVLEELHEPATRSVQAHLVRLVRLGTVVELSDGRFASVA